MKKIEELAKINKRNKEFKAYLLLGDFYINDNTDSLEKWAKYNESENIKDSFKKQLKFKKLIDGGRPILEKIKPVIDKKTGKIVKGAECLAALVILEIDEIAYDEF